MNSLYSGSLLSSLWMELDTIFSGKPILRSLPSGKTLLTQLCLTWKPSLLQLERVLLCLVSGGASVILITWVTSSWGWPGLCRADSTIWFRTFTWSTWSLCWCTVTHGTSASAGKSTALRGMSTAKLSRTAFSQEYTEDSQTQSVMDTRGKENFPQDDIEHQTWELIVNSFASFLYLWVIEHQIKTKFSALSQNVYRLWTLPHFQSLKDVYCCTDVFCFFTHKIVLHNA